MERAPAQSRPLPHACDTQTTRVLRCLRIETRTIILHNQLQAVGKKLQSDTHTARFVRSVPACLVMLVSVS